MGIVELFILPDDFLNGFLSDIFIVLFCLNLF